MNRYPILELDSGRSIITPRNSSCKEFNEHLIICFFKDVIEYLIDIGKITKVSTFKSELGDYSLYTLHYNLNKISVIHSPTGAPLAAGLLEESIACGAKYVIGYGNCGVLDNSKEDRVFIPFSAIRDEGTSYHYVKASKEIELNPKVVDVLVSIIENHDIEYDLTKTWSTDGVFRITERKAKKIKSEGCLIMEMECSALAAVSKYRNIKFGQIFFSTQEAEKSIEELASNKMKIELFWLAAESCLML